jgi:hypothetical protein
MMILVLMRLVFLMTSSHNKPVPNNRMPITVKSVMSQSTAFVNCMAISGVSNRMAAALTFANPDLQATVYDMPS